VVRQPTVVDHTLDDDDDDDDDDALHPKAKHRRLDPLGGETSTLSSNLAVILTNPESIQTMGDQEYYHMPVEHPAIVGKTSSMDPQEDDRRSRTRIVRAVKTMMGRRLMKSHRG
jgi:hypothetical protein